ncbi:MAG TPA: flagellar export chaperone FlgN [Solirubrobacteraceae bacterium]|nr:flagellar export chaperone FlgN [Solirubrobacteraceae bacterium]
MSALHPQVVTLDSPVDDVLGNDVLGHLEAQLVSARRLLHVVLEQGAAIRVRDVQNVVLLTGLLQAELQRRAVIERERTRLLERAGLRLGVNPGAVTLTLMEQLMSPRVAQTARSASAELRGLLAEVQREHHVNRALMNQELAFLDHLLRLVDSDRQLGYDSAGDRSRATAPRLASRHRVLDLEV